MIRTRWLLLFSLLFFWSCAFCSLSKAEPSVVFYQPQNGDTQITQDQWGEIFRRLKENGYRKLILQWTRYGNEQFGGPNGWLATVAKQAKAAGLLLEVGLYADPSYFQWIQKKDTGFTIPFTQYVKETLAAADAWHPLGLADSWYLPAEFDDLNWQDPVKRQQLMQALSELASQLPPLSHPPALSVFFAGYSSPDELNLWYREFQQQGWRVWIQDGSGTRHLPTNQRMMYLTQLLSCPAGKHASALVIEGFNQTSAPDQAFTAQALDAAALAKRNAEYTQLCPSEVSVFSLRYLPLAIEFFKPPAK